MVVVVELGRRLLGMGGEGKKAVSWHSFGTPEITALRSVGHDPLK